jgi:hypothetical protein
MYSIMGGGNVDTWHDHMYICTLYVVVVLVAHLQQL